MKEIRGLILAITLVVTECSLLYSVPVQAQPSLVFVGIVRNNIGYFYRLDVNGMSLKYVGEAGWDTCPQNTILVGHNVHPNGFWFCASSELANQGTWYFGNVVKNQGIYWEISGHTVKAVGDNVGRDTCWSGQLLNRSSGQDSFWICAPSQSSQQPSHPPTTESKS